MENGTLSSVKFSGCKCRKTASFDFKLKKRGKKFNVYKGRMHSCCADIQYAAVKASANEKGSSSDLVDYVMALEAAINIALRFSKCFKNNLTVQFPELHLAVMDNVSVFNKLFSMGSRALSSEEYVLFEPYIKDLKYFVTAEGIVTDTCPVVIQELCHFSYHESNGMNVLRGLRGTWEKNGKSFRLASPSTKYFVEKCTESEIPCAINNFFQTHRCTAVCEKWLVPNQKQCAPAAMDISTSGACGPVMELPPSYSYIVESH